MSVEVTGRPPGTDDPESSSAPSTGTRRRRSVKKGTGRLAAILVSPTLIVLGLVVAYPILSALHESLFRARDDLDAQGFVIEGDVFVGARNFTDILFGPEAERFWNAFWNTTFFTVTTVALETVLGVAMALVMHRALRGRAFVRASILVPWAVPTAVSALMWRWIFAPDGIANLALGRQILWSADAVAAKVAVITAEVWKTAPFVGLLVLAGLQLIPQEVHEAARVDGASGWSRFWRITLPLIKPALLVAVLFRMLDALRMFDLPFVLIGQQKDSVETLSMLAWTEATNIQFGPAAAYATIMFAYVALVAFAFVKMLGADVIGDARTSVRRKRSAPAGKEAAR
ncbi:ABC transporter permease subunit [Allosaccharopolyspora coralli]|uniref:ABC transporter permease subunit n=1 Tax=Allosaccharopolyspora coralli TaxID=2665642 RepID=A0A5Q3Q609_9PSEU|nr:sugar ABC transporter permease [Allosaccharopolyspora coralli]QGK70061.1 ABC transporter permease subunit [Allosaccharopolyspora coralli]